MGIIRLVDDEHPVSESDLQHQIDALREQVDTNRKDLDALLTRADNNHLRAAATEARADADHQRLEASEARQDVSGLRADASEARADKDRLRIDDLEAHVDLDRLMILELQAEGLLSKEHVEHLQEALRTSRRIGAALGIIMTDRLVSEADAFEILRTASNNNNCKVRDLADDLVLTGDVSVLTSA